MTKAIISSTDDSIGKALTATLRQQFGDSFEVEPMPFLNFDDLKKKRQKLINCDILFIDLDDWIDVSASIQKSLEIRGIPIICISKKESNALKAIRLHAADFLLKPLNTNELRKTLKVLKLRRDPLTALQNHSILQHTPNKIAISGIKQTIFVSPNDIVRIEFKNPHSILYLLNGKTHYSTKPLKEFDNLLANCNFVRVNPSTLINIAHVIAHINGEGGFAVMSDGEKVCISRRKKNNFMEKVQI